MRYIRYKGLKHMDFTTLYSMNGGSTYGALYVRPRTPIVDDLTLMKAEALPSEPVVFEYSGGGKPRDVIETEYPILELFSDRIVDVLQNKGFRGWTTYPVIIYGKKGELVEGYHGFAVTGRCGPIDNSLSRQIVVPPPVPQGQPGPGWQGLYFDPDSWDDSDIFTPQGGWVFVVEAVRKALKRARVKNLYFRSLTEIVRLML